MTSDTRLLSNGCADMGIQSCHLSYSKTFGRSHKWFLWSIKWTQHRVNSRALSFQVAVLKPIACDDSVLDEERHAADWLKFEMGARWLASRLKSSTLHNSVAVVTGRLGKAAKRAHEDSCCWQHLNRGREAQHRHRRRCCALTTLVTSRHAA